VPLVANAIVLVHGAWLGAWCWERVAPRLSERGLRVIALDLPGHGADSEEMADLHGDAAKVVETLDRLGEPVVLVGHSYGGAVITEAGEHPAVEQLVFIAGMVLDTDESCTAAALSESAAAGISFAGRPDLSEGFVDAWRESVVLERTMAAACLFNDCDDATAAWALDRLQPHRLGSLQQSPRNAAWRTKPSTYASCANDLVVHPDLQNILAARCSASTSWPTGHAPFLSSPELVIELLSQVTGLT
jgi:pimeloyl-ACP methyl ester carboxylesterase